MNLKQKIVDWLLKDEREKLKKELTFGYNTDSEMKLKNALYDFFKNYDGTLSVTNLNYNLIDPSINNNNNEENNSKVYQNMSKNVRPKDVYDELERVPTPIDIIPENIDKKITLLKRKIELGEYQFYTNEQMQAMIQRLEYRKKYYLDYKDFFEQFDYTTQDKIDELLTKYPNLTMKQTTLFIPTFPEEAIDKMEKYTNTVKEFTDGQKPIYYVIANKKDFEEKQRKLDPILLVQSPFGFFWQILGAWDEEMLLLDEFKKRIIIEIN